MNLENKTKKVKINVLITSVFLLFFNRGICQDNNTSNSSKIKFDVTQKDEVDIIKLDFRNIDLLFNLSLSDLNSTMLNYEYELNGSDDINKSYLFLKKKSKTVQSIFWVNNGNVLAFTFPLNDRQLSDDFKNDISNAIDNRLIILDNLSIRLDENSNPMEEYWIKTIKYNLNIKFNVDTLDGDKINFITVQKY